MRGKTATILGGFGVIALGTAAVVNAELPALAAGGLIHPARRATTRTVPARCAETEFAGEGVVLRGWSCRPPASARGTVVYLHGIADNRGSAVGVITRFTSRGFNVIAYDSRAHGASEGDACTYGYFEKRDLHRILDTLPAEPIVLLGTSLGAAVALQEAADDPRVSAVVAAETFSDLRTVATERAPGFLTIKTIDRAFRLAEEEAHFRVDDVRPEVSAGRITVPVLVIHGADDVETAPAHSERVYRALNGPKRFILVAGARHNGSLTPEVWNQIDQWLDQMLQPSRERR